MRPHPTERLLAHFNLLAPMMPLIARRFIALLARRDPDAAAALPPEFVQDPSALVAGAALVCRNLDKLGMVGPVLADLGESDPRIRCLLKYSQSVRGAMIEAFREASGDSWTNDLEFDLGWLLGQLIAMAQRGNPPSGYFYRGPIREPGADQGAGPIIETRPMNRPGERKPGR